MVSYLLKRVENEYIELFDQEYLTKHTAFIVKEGTNIFAYTFNIISSNSAIVYYDEIKYLDEVIDEFRFYSGFIIYILNKDHKLIKSFDEVKLIKLNINQIQPSQFYVSKKKVERLISWVKNEGDIIIPIIELNDEFVACDGHTRLKVAQILGFKEIYAYIEHDSSDYLSDFVKFAKEKNIYSIKDLDIIEHDQYEILWNQFCDNYFKDK